MTLKAKIDSGSASTDPSSLSPGAAAIDVLSLTRDCRKTVSSLKVQCMECAKEELIDALSLTRERVRVWVSQFRLPKCFRFRMRFSAVGLVFIAVVGKGN
jgi:hypothetical protein